MAHIFESINRGYNQLFQTQALSLGVVVPIESYPNGPIPSMHAHVERVQLVESLGFKGVWLRDVPFHVPQFGDAGQTFDPFSYMGYLAAKTSEITLGAASIALPLHQPVHVAKAAATVDQLSNGRFVMGVASGDRSEEYPAMGLSHERRGAMFRDAFNYIRASQEAFPTLETSHFGNLPGSIDVLPKPTAHKLPMLVTGYSQQSMEWNAQHGDGWMHYPRDLYTQQQTIARWRSHIPEDGFDKPFMQPLYIDLVTDPDTKPTPIHLGFRLGISYLIAYLEQLKVMGVNHVALNLRFNTGPVEATLESIATHVLPHFHHHTSTEILC